MELIKNYLQESGYTKTFPNRDNIIDNGRIMVSFISDEIIITDKYRSSGMSYSQCYYNLFHGKIDSLEDFKKLMKQINI